MVTSASSNCDDPPVVVPTPTYPTCGMYVKIRAPTGRLRRVLEYQGRPPAETKPNLRASSQLRPLSYSPNETYQSRPFHGSRIPPLLGPPRPGAAASTPSIAMSS